MQYFDFILHTLEKQDQPKAKSFENNLQANNDRRAEAAIPNSWPVTTAKTVTKSKQFSTMTSME